MQLLTAALPALEDLQKNERGGRSTENFPDYPLRCSWMGNTPKFVAVILPLVPVCGSTGSSVCSGDRYCSDCRLYVCDVGR